MRCNFKQLRGDPWHRLCHDALLRIVRMRQISDLTGHVQACSVNDPSVYFDDEVSGVFLA